MDPSSGELAEMKTLKDITDWVGLEDKTKRKTRTGLWDAIGEPTLVRHLASIPWSAWNLAVAQLQVDVVTGTATAPIVTSSPPTAVELGQVGSVRRVARLLMGVDPDETAVASGAAAAAPGAGATAAAPETGPKAWLTERKIKLSVVMDQADDT